MSLIQIRCQRVSLTVFAVVLMATLPACDNTGHARLSPKSNEARVALEAVLSAWRDGRPYDKLESTPVVRVIDSAWRDAQSLESFEILTEEQSDDRNKV